MLRLIGMIFVMFGCIGLGVSMRSKMKDNLITLNKLLQIFKMLQNEIIYSKASLPEACRKIADKTEEPYKHAFYEIYNDMNQNRGCSFGDIWKKNIESCLLKLPIAQEDKKVLISFGDCAGFIDELMQAKTIERYMHNLEITIKKLEDDMANKSKVIMSLSVMGGLLITIILI